MEIAIKRMTTTKHSFNKLIYFILIYQFIYLITIIDVSSTSQRRIHALFMQNALNVNFKRLHSNKTKNITASTLKFNKLSKYATTKRRFKNSCKNNVSLKRNNKDCFRSLTCCSFATHYIYVKSSQHDKHLKKINRLEKFELKVSWPYLVMIA